jgi:hypothetical protein
VGLLEGWKATSIALAAVKFQIGCVFIEPDDGYIESDDVIEVGPGRRLRRECVITERRIVLGDGSTGRVVWSLPYTEVAAVPRVRLGLSALWEASAEHDHQAARRTGRMELEGGGRRMELVGRVSFLRSVRRAIRQARSAPDGRAVPTRRQVTAIEKIAAHLGVG